MRFLSCVSRSGSCAARSRVRAAPGRRHRESAHQWMGPRGVVGRLGLEQGVLEKPVPRQFGDLGAVVVTGEAQPVVAQGAGVPGARSVRVLVAFRGRTRAERFLGARIGLDVGARRRLLRPRPRACPPARPQTRGECRVLKFFGRVAPGNRTSCPRRSTGIRRRSGRRAAAPASARRSESGRTRSSSRCGRAVRRRGLPARPDRWRSWPWSMSEDGGPKFRNPSGF